MPNRSEYQQLDQPTIARTRSTRLIASLLLVIVFTTLFIDMGWDVFRTMRMTGTATSGFDKCLVPVSDWPRWDVDLRYSRIYNATVPAVGVKGSVTMNDGKTFPIEFVQVDRPSAVVYQTKHSLGTTLDWYWNLIDIDATGYTLKMGVKCQGPLSWVFGLALKTKCLEAFDKCLPEFKKVAEA